MDLVQTFIRTYQLLFFFRSKNMYRIKDNLCYLYNTESFHVSWCIFLSLFLCIYFQHCVLFTFSFLERYGISLSILIDVPSSLIIYTTYSLQENNIDLNDYIKFIFRIHHPYLLPLLSIPAKRSVDLVILQQISFYLNVSSYSDQVLRLDSQK